MDVGRILSTFPPIVENIFKNLSQRDLDSCSEVCELWRRVAETERNNREDIFWFFQGLYCDMHETIHSSCRECTLDTARDIENEMNMQFKDLKITPTFCLSFASSYFINEYERLFPSFKYPPSSQAKRAKREEILTKRAYLKAAIHTALKQHLPEKCKLTFCVAPGIIGSRGHRLPVEVEEGCAISGILIPHVPGLQIYNFPIDEKKCDISKIIPENTKIKCLLVFVTPYDSSCYNKIIQSCLLRENSKLAVGGAIIDRCETHSGSVVAFCGESVKAASVIISPKDKREEVEKKLKLFERTGLLRDRCFAFMFACVARGYFIYRRYNLESSVFYGLYPEIPLTGVFGNGEIGIDYLPNAPGETQVLRLGKLARCRKRHLHSYTTVFVMVSVRL